MLAKVRRLMAISLALTAVGVAAVLGIIGYRVFTNEGSRPVAAPADITVALPQGARVIATAVSGDRLVVTVEMGGRTEVRVFDLATLQARGVLKFAPAP